MNGQTSPTSTPSEKAIGGSSAQNATGNSMPLNSGKMSGTEDGEDYNLTTILADLFEEVGIEDANRVTTYSAPVGNHSTLQNRHLYFTRNHAPCWGIKELPPKIYLLENKLILN